MIRLIIWDRPPANETRNRLLDTFLTTGQICSLPLPPAPMGHVYVEIDEGYDNRTTFGKTVLMLDTQTAQLAKEDFREAVISGDSVGLSTAIKEVLFALIDQVRKPDQVRKT